MNGDELRIHFHPDHWADLCNSGLSPETIQSLGIYSARPGDIPKILGFDPSSVQSALVFPYPHNNGFCRVKVFPPLTDSSGRTNRYLQRKRSGVHLYFTPAAYAALANPAIDWVWAEGEKKAAKAYQEQMICGGIGGLWLWIEENQAISDLDRIVHNGRKETIVPDSDVWARPDLLKAVYAFGRELQARGAVVQVVALPATDDGRKVGLDDFLLIHSTQDLAALPHFVLTDTAFKGLAKWWSGWRRKKLQPQPPSNRPGWQAQLSTTTGGVVKETLGNITLALQHLKPWATAAWYDVVRDLLMVGEHELDDLMVTEAGLALEAQANIPIRSKDLVARALTYLCRQQSRDLLQEWLEGLPAWDNTPRLDTWLQTYAHTPIPKVDPYDGDPGAYSKDVSRLLIVSMVARALDPGCQYRFVVILESPENAGKTKLVRALATPTWYRELSHDLNGKEAHMRIKRAWVAELAELSSLGKTEEARLKSFFTLNEDAYIPKFSNFEVVHKRRAVFVGTVNPEGDNTYLRSQTGNTRYLPISVCHINLEGFEQVRIQLFAEALHYYRNHPHDWWQLSSDGEAMAQTTREERRQRSVYEDDLGAWLERIRKDVTWWEEIAKDYLSLPKERWADRRIQMEVGKALKALGWEKGKRERMGDQGLVVPWRPGSDWKARP
jgi:hypothetical protein